MIRLKIRQDFERNRHVTDLGVINMLLFKNQQEYQETMNCWKQEVSPAKSPWGRHRSRRDFHSPFLYTIPAPHHELVQAV